MKTILILTLDCIVQVQQTNAVVKVKLYHSLDFNFLPDKIYIPALKASLKLGESIFDMAYNVYYVQLYQQLWLPAAEGDSIVNNLREHLWVDDPKKLNIPTSILEI